MNKLAFLILASLGVSSQMFGGEAADIAVEVPASSIEGLSQPLDAKATAVVVTSGGKQVPLLLSADTSIVKESKSANAKSNGLIVRDNRWTQSLLKLDMSGIADGKEIDSAEFRFIVSNIEKPGNAVFKCYRILTNWSENATWFSPDPGEGKTWNGLKSGTDFEAQPFATWETPMLKKGDQISIPNFAEVVRLWSTGQSPNHGFLLTVGGTCTQVAFPSRELAMAAPSFTVGGSGNARVLVRFDPELIGRVLVQPDDLHDAALRVRIPNHRQFKKEGVVRVIAENGSVAATMPLSSIDQEGWIESSSVKDFLKPNPVFILECSTPLVINTAKQVAPKLKLAITDRPKVLLFDNKVKPQTGVYNRVKGGHFSYGGRRLRLWGMVGHGDPKRLERMGFNAKRVWHPRLDNIYRAKNFPADVAKRGELPPTTMGDGSVLDIEDKKFAEVKKQGMFVMLASLCHPMPLKPLLVDDSYIAGGPDWPQWKEAVASAKSDYNLISLGVYFDERLQKVREKSAAVLLNHVNPYTGTRYAEDECIAIYEIWNENAAIRRLMDGESSLPPYFQEKVRKAWANWVIAKYKNEAGIKAAWGQLGEGETLASLKFAPKLSERSSYPAARGRDYVEFLVASVSGYNKKLVDYCRTFAPPGKGINVVPFSFDTQFRPSIPWLYADSLGDVNCPGMYYWSLKPSLDAPPLAYLLDGHTVAGKPTVLYETNHGRPSSYRTEYPFKLVALASWQDWDGIFWQYWAAGAIEKDEDFLTEPLQHITVEHYWQGVEHEKDPVMTTLMALAGRAFLNQSINPASSPAIYHIGRDGIFGFDYANGLGMKEATFSRGAKVKFDPTSDKKLTIENPVPAEPIREAVKGGDEIFWDWPNGRLIIDSPAVKAYVGRVGANPYTFRDGFTLSGLDVPWVVWGLVSSDGAPLVEAKKALIAAVVDAQNTGFDFDWQVAGGPTDYARAFRDKGRAPVVVDRVSYTVSFPCNSDYIFSGYDFATRETAKTVGADTNVLRVRKQALWMGQIEFQKRGAMAKVIVDPNVGAEKSPADGGEQFADVTDQRLASVWNPIRGISWGDSYARAHAALRNTDTVASGISRQDTSGAAAKLINWMGSEALFSAPANIEISFQNDHMTQIVATFIEPPSLKEDVVPAYEAKFGQALEKAFRRQEEESLARWTVSIPEGTLSIKASETQGTQIILYQFTPGKGDKS